MTKKPVEGRPKAGSLDPRIVPDAKWPGIYRIRLPDGSLSDMANLTRIKDALRATGHRMVLKILRDANAPVGGFGAAVSTPSVQGRYIRPCTLLCIHKS